jgi:hypothetical protein
MTGRTIATRRTTPDVALLSQVLLGVALIAGLAGWRDPDQALRVVVGTIGAAALALATFAARRRILPWLVVAVDGWFVALGLTLGQSVRGAQMAVSGQWDPGPGEEELMIRFEHWLDPVVRMPVIAVLVVVGIVGMLAAIRSTSAGRTLAD